MCIILDSYYILTILREKILTTTFTCTTQLVGVREVWRNSPSYPVMGGGRKFKSQTLVKVTVV